MVDAVDPAVLRHLASRKVREGGEQADLMHDLVGNHVCQHLPQACERTSGRWETCYKGRFGGFLTDETSQEETR